MPIFSLSVSVCICATFVVFTDCERCARPISINPGSMEAGEYGLTRGTCFVERHLEMVAVAGLLWISSCVLGAARLFRVFFFVFFFRTHTAWCTYEATSCLIYLSTSNSADIDRSTYSVFNCPKMEFHAFSWNQLVAILFFCYFSISHDTYQVLSVSHDIGLLIGLPFQVVLNIKIILRSINMGTELFNNTSKDPQENKIQ